MGRTHIRTKNYHTHTEKHKAQKPQIPTLENKYHVYSLIFFTLWNLIKNFFFLEQSLKINKYNQCYTFKLNLSNCVEMKYYANLAKCTLWKSFKHLLLKGLPASVQIMIQGLWFSDNRDWKLCWGLKEPHPCEWVICDTVKWLTYYSTITFYKNAGFTIAYSPFWNETCFTGELFEQDFNRRLA